jgi:hypothetical protein
MGAAEMRLASTTLLFAGAAAALALAAHPAVAATALNGELNIVANAYVNQHPTVTSMDSQNWAAVPASLNVNALAVANNGIFADHNERVSSFGSAQATWASANAGSVDFTNYGWNFSVTNPATLASGADLDINRPGSGLDWVYTFQATGDGVLQMNYHVTGSGDAFGLQGWTIGFNGPSFGGPAPNQFDDPTQSGVFQGFLTAGQTYTIYLVGNTNIAGTGTQSFAGSMDGTFDWQITERDAGVPEPATWALMLVGFGGMGAALRRRRRLSPA